MKSKRIKVLLAAIMTGVMIFTNHTPCYVYAEGDDDTTQIADVSDVVDEDQNAPSDGTEIVDIEEEIRNDESDPGEEVVWQEPKADWYEDYQYGLCYKGYGFTEDILRIESAKESLSGNIVIPATVVIDDREFIVELDNFHEGPNIWYPARENVTGIKISSGVRINNNACTEMFYAGWDNDNRQYIPSALTTVVFENVDTSNITSMEKMFEGCTSLKSVDISCFNTSKVTDMSYMFCGCSSLQSLDISNFDTSNVSDMFGMFENCTSLRELKLGDLDTSKATSLGWMFYNCSSLTTVDVGKWNISNVLYLDYLFKGCSSLSALDVSKWDTSNVTSLESLFDGCSSLTTLDVSKWNTSNMQKMAFVFARCSKLSDLNVSEWDLSNAEYTSGMFLGCSSLTNLDVSKWNVSNIGSINWMFQDCSQLTSLDVSNWDTSNVEDIKEMFSGCTMLKTLDVSKWDTSKVVYMYSVFNGCNSLTNLDVSNWITSEVTDMSWVFNGCSSLTAIDVSKWDTSNATQIYGIFSGCSKITKLDLSNWDLSKLPYGTSIFKECNSLSYIHTPKKVSADCIIGLPHVFYNSRTGEEVYEIDNTCTDTILVTDLGEIDESISSPMNPVPEITDTTTKLYLVKGQKFTLPGEGWQSGNKSILTISKKGVLNAKKESADPVNLTKGEQVIDVYISKPSYNKKTVTLNAGTNEAIGFNYDSANLDVVWYSNAPDVATISDDGMVHAIAKGTATITAYVNGCAYNCKVKVKEEAALQDRTLHMTLKGKKTISIKGIKKVTWVSDDEGVASVTKKNKITANAAGKTVLRTEYEGNEYLIHVFVEDPTITTQNIQSAGKNKYKLNLAPGGSAAIEFASIDQPVIFKSSKGETAFADADGIIYANKPGKAKLTAKINGKTVTITVTVQ